jgi:hypothetical protein
MAYYVRIDDTIVLIATRKADVAAYMSSILTDPSVNGKNITVDTE